MKSITTYYVLVMMDDIDPEMFGPFSTKEERDQKARNLRGELGGEHGVHWVDTITTTRTEVGAYSSAFFNEDEE